MSEYVADFETTIEEDKTRVWAFGHCEIGNVENFAYGNNMDDFVEWCRIGKNKTVYFHNLRFDGEFIIHWLLTHGFEHSKQKESKTFNCIISSSGAFYSIEVIFERKNKKYRKVVFQDSAKKLPFSVDQIGKSFKLPVQKLDVPENFYALERPEGHELTEFEVAYLKADVQTVALALGIQFEQDLDRMTVGSDALHSYKKTLGEGDIKIGRKVFVRDFPVLPLAIDMDIRHSYRGGFTFLMKKFAGKDVKTGIVYDVNSLYPSVMYNCWLPYGMPLAFLGEYQEDEFYPLYLQRLTCTFKLKKNHIPTIQIKHGGRFTSTEYLETSKDSLGNDEVTLVLTSVDLKLFMEHYDVTVIEYEGGWKFKQCKGVFKEYIDHWTAIKVANAKEKNALYHLAKLMLNNLYGKFATNPDVTGRYPYLNDRGAVSYTEGDKELSDPVYTAMGSFITAYAREITIRTAQKVYHRFIYADTDSIHLLGDEVPDIEIHDSALGKWAWEGTFKRARFVRAKTYIEDMYAKVDENGKLKHCSKEEATTSIEHVTCAGMPDNVKEGVTWENFRKGLSLPGKLMPTHVPGGIVLKPVNYTIS